MESGNCLQNLNCNIFTKILGAEKPYKRTQASRRKEGAS